LIARASIHLLDNYQKSLSELDISKAYAFNKPLGTLPITLKKPYLHIDYHQQLLTTTSSTLVCIRQSIDDQDTLQEQQDFMFDHIGEIAEDEYGASDIDTDSDDVSPAQHKC
jgi:hypothetical protein